MHIGWIAWTLACAAVVGSGCTAAQPAGLPQDVAKFIEDRESCEHFADELPPPGQPERLKEVMGNARLYCTGIDKRLDALKAEYSGNAGVSKKLDTYVKLGERTSRSQSPYAPPDEVEDFVSDRDICDHLRGEIPEPGVSASDGPTIDDITRACAGTDQRLEKLRAKYANDTSIIEALSTYEWPIEAVSD